MKKTVPLILALPVCMGLMQPLDAQLSVRNSLTTGNGNPDFLLDGQADTSWTRSSASEGNQATFLLDDPTLVEAVSVLADSANPTAYQLMASSNYRDWVILSEGMPFTTIDTMEAIEIAPETALYLRFLDRGNASPVDWELVAGDTTAVEASLDNLRPFDWGDPTEPLVIAEMLDAAFDWQMDHLASRDEGIGWINGAFYTGVSALYELTEESKYRQAIIDIGTEAAWQLRERSGGKGLYHADDHCIGQAWTELYLFEENPLSIWYIDTKQRLDYVMANPLPGRQDMNWCDALYMSPPNYVRMAELTGEDAYRTFIDTQWWDVTDFLYDTEYDLFYRDSSYFDDREPNGMPVFWSRGNGWVVGGLVRMLQYMPEDWPRRAEYLQLLEEMAASLAAIQGESDGLWSSSLLYPEKYDMERETSGSAFFTYGIAWAVNEGLLDKATYGPVIESAWEGLSKMLTKDGVVRFIQQVGAGPARNNGQTGTKDYGYGAYLLAGTEMIRYYAREPVPAYARVESTTPVEVVGNANAWTLVDGFENAFSWTVVKDISASENLIPDPNDAAGSQVFSINTGNRTSGYYRATTDIPPIANGTTATVYQRFAYDNPEIDVVFGASDESTVNAYGDYETGTRIYFGLNQLEARAGGSYISIGDDLLQLETWYEIWTVVDNTNDTYDVYLRGGSNYPVVTLMQEDMSFRNGTSRQLVSWAIAYNSQYCEGAFLMDDLFIDTSGVNLTRPSTVRQTQYSPWSGIGRYRPSLAKLTDIGWLWDESYPWIYHQALDSWGYTWTQDAYAGGYWIYLLERDSWIWFSTDWTGWWYNSGTDTWDRLNP